MKILHFIFGLVLFLLMAAVGVGMIHASTQLEWWQKALAFLSGLTPWWIAGGGAALVLLVFLYLLSGLTPPRREQFITFETEGGSVSISVRAIRDYLSRLDSEFAAIIEMETELQSARGQLGVTLDISVRAGTQIPELCRLLQDRVKETIKQNLGDCDLRGVQINVREIVSDNTGAAEAPA